MIVGLLTMIALFVMRFWGDGESAPMLPESVELPEGARAAAITAGNGWYAVVTTDDTILVFDRRSGELRQTIPIETGPSGQ